MQNKITDLTKKLIEFKSISQNPKELSNIVDFVENYFNNKKVFIKRYVKNNKPSIVITFEKTKNPDIFLNGHLDVVNASNDEFKSKIKDNKLYGRGSADMKGSVAIMMLVMDHFLEIKKRPSIGLMLTTDEETGGRDGAEYLVEKEKYRSKVAIVPDGGEDILKIIHKSKGVLHLKITAKGKAYHGSMPWLGDNAIDKLVNGYINLKKIFPVIGKKNYWKPTLNLGAITGGEIPNKVPDQAQMLLDIRFTEKENAQDLLNKIKKIFKGSKVEVLTTGNVFYSSDKNQYITQYVKTVNNITRKNAIIAPTFGALDARYFSKKNIPVIVNQPICGNTHANGEWIDIKSMENYYDVLIEYVNSVAG